MGQTLGAPVTKKDTSFCRNKDFEVGCSCMQGWRVNMEDEHVILLSAPEDHEASFFGVYDGHGGVGIARYAARHLHNVIMNREEYRSGNVKRAIERGFLQADDQMQQDNSLASDPSGTTANIIILRRKRLYCGNAGDSRSIAVVNGALTPLSFDHKPVNSKEKKRIYSAGGWVEFGRVNGNLALSRALGDFVFKQCAHLPPEEQMVTAMPDVIEKAITKDWEFIVMACDGIWDVMSSQEVASFVRSKLSLGIRVDKICEDLMMECLSNECRIGGVGCDNMSVIIISFMK